MRRMPPPPRWGILSTGWIANVFARAVAATPKAGWVSAVGSRSEESARRFAAEHAIPRAHGSYEALVEDPQVEAVYVATPHPQHFAWVARAAQAGKHVLCEKPAGMNHAEAQSMIAAARNSNVLFMEAFMYRFHPQTRRVIDLIRSGVLGTVHLVQGTFSFHQPYDRASRLWNREHGGGGILDVGCYPVSWARLIAGILTGHSFDNPLRVAGSACLRDGIDFAAAATLEFRSGLIAQVACGIGLEQDSSLRIYGSDAWLHLNSPYTLEFASPKPQILVHRPAREPEAIDTASPRPLHGFQAEAFARAVAAGKGEVEEMTPRNTLGNMAALDAWRASAGVTYPQDEAGHASAAR